MCRCQTNTSLSCTYSQASTSLPLEMPAEEATARNQWRNLTALRYCKAWIAVKLGSNEDESRWELAGESLHECFLNSHCSVKRAVRVAWELTRVFLLFSISLFLLVASTLLFLRFLTFVKLLTVRVITPTVTCQWYVIIFSFFLLVFFLLWVMTWKSLASGFSSVSVRKTLAKKHRPFCWAHVTAPCNCKVQTVYLMQLSWPVKRAKPLIDSPQNLNQLKVDESAWD